MRVSVSFHPVAVKATAVGGWACAALVLAGCGTSQAPVHPVRGKVLFEGKPIPHALVVFHPTQNAEKDAPRPRAQVGPDGSFALGTFAGGDGAPAGDYAVTVEWWLTSAKKGVDSDLPATNRLPVRYATASGSGLRVKVEAGDNELPPLHLKK
jgi:hypothetical protein